ncbi:MAG: hypothetical protein ACOY0S_04475 [Patescibacteria group bacterium]
MKRLILILIILIILASPVKHVSATEESEAAARLVTQTATADKRSQQLQAFLAAHNSPLTEEANHFVSEADRLNLDWKLVAAIAGVESTFGRFIPTNSFNAWGWGVFTGLQDGVHFKDWKDGITQVSEGLRHNYLDRGATTIEQIGRIYAASPAWPWKVRYFLAKIEGFTPNRPEQLEVIL